ncbi:flavodoxin family protein [Acidaminobacter sp. JC074]|uniref:flavodoxin family protein n=1 Tax=Acidaminobacter sp. JC074 TaxID=2530199 RepID=UPI001F1114C4|nr:flavodoxin family protein [Acidaminobacter sp. JC074]
MKTLIINGSSRIGGDTSALVDELVKHLEGEVKVLTVEDHIEPCNDCRDCWEEKGCTLEDDFTDIYPYLYECDNLVIASPVWFSALSGPSMNIGSRVQYIYASNHIRKDPIEVKRKKGAVIFVGAEPGTEEIPFKTARTMMKFMNVNRDELKVIKSMNTMELKACDDHVALNDAKEVAVWFNQTVE